LVGDPLLLLPRAWSNSAAFNLEQAVEVADQASEFAQENYQNEARWYKAVCGGELSSPMGVENETNP
jgi:hypothetical protein